MIRACGMVVTMAMVVDMVVSMALALAMATAKLMVIAEFAPNCALVYRGACGHLGANLGAPVAISVDAFTRKAQPWPW